MPAMMTQPFAPNTKIVAFTPTDNSAYYLMVDSNSRMVPEDCLPTTPAGRPIYVGFRVVTSAGNADGSGAQLYFGGTTAPAANTTGQFISGSGQWEFLPGGFRSVWVKPVTNTDIVEALIGY